MKKNLIIAVLALVGIATHLVLRFLMVASTFSYHLPLLVVLSIGGTFLIADLLIKVWRREFGSDLLAGIAIVTSIILGEYLAGTLVVLMLSGGEALEGFAVRNASFALENLAKRLPSIVHRQTPKGMEEVSIQAIRIGDILVLHPHEVCPTDGIVVQGHGVMDEAYLTGEPFHISKAPGTEVISGAINGETLLTIRATKLPIDSRYAKIMEVMKTAALKRPHIRRLGNQLGAYYTPIALTIAGIAWLLSGSSLRFLSVLVVATPCPLLIAIPVAIIGSISLAAKRGIIIRDPAIMEQVNLCRTVILDKTGTLTYGRPELTEIVTAGNADETTILALAASLEQYSKHPLAEGVLKAAQARKISLTQATEVSEIPGGGLNGKVAGKVINITNRKTLVSNQPAIAAILPKEQSGLECIIMINHVYSAMLRFHDGPRKESRSFIEHLTRKHPYRKVMLVSGDREEEVRYLASMVGIHDLHASRSPEEKVALVQAENRNGPTIFIGDGINDAPALATATIGIAIGQRSDVTAEAAGAVVMDSSLVKVDELLHISSRMRRVAMQSAVGGMGISVVGMLFAAWGYLPAVAGAITQEIIDVLAILNSLRACVRPKTLSDF